jgi:hypothetical protein
MTIKVKRSINKTKKGGGVSKKNRSNKTPKKESSISERRKPNVVMMLKNSGSASGSANTELYNNTAFEQKGEFIPETREEREERKKREMRIALYRSREAQTRSAHGSKSMMQNSLRRAAKKTQKVIKPSYNMKGLQYALPEVSLQMKDLLHALPNKSA